MTTLSWLLYAAEALGTLRETSGVVAFMCIFALIFSVIAYFVTKAESRDPEDSEWIYKRLVRPILLTLLLAGIFGTLIPSRQTILMIAATEAGHSVVQTNEAREVFNDLKDILRNKLKALKEDK